CFCACGYHCCSTPIATQPPASRDTKNRRPRRAAAQAGPRRAFAALATRPGVRLMPTLIPAPTRIQAAGNKPKLIEEFVGRANAGHEALSIAHMHSPGGWVEPGQRPEFDEFTVVLRGALRVEFEGGQLEVRAGQAVVAHRGEWVRYSTPGEDGAE